MDIIATTMSSVTATTALILTSIFGVQATTQTETVPEPPRNTIVQTIEHTDANDDTIVLCGSGGLVPSSAPKCPTNQ